MCVCVCVSVCHIRRSIMSTFVFCVRMAIYHWYRPLLVCTPVCHTSVFSRHIHNFCRAMHMHSADYTVTTCLSDRLSIWLSIRQTCTHLFLFSFFCICMPSHSYAQCLCFASICPYTAMYPCVLLPHSYISYCTPLSTCPFSCKCTVVCAKAEARGSVTQ